MLAVSSRPGHQPAAVAPILDRRHRLSWRQRLPARLGTGALWLGSFSLLGPLKLSALVLAGGLLAPCALALDRNRRLMPVSLPPAALQSGAQPSLPRSAMAAEWGLAESLLFRARHAALCTVHHDDEGRIVALQLARPAQSQPQSLPLADAHSVG